MCALLLSPRWLFEKDHVKRYYEGQGNTVEREKEIGDRCLDLYVADEELAIEINCHNKVSLETQNMIGALSNVGNGMFVCNSKERLSAIKRSIPSEYIDRIEFKLFCEFLKKKGKK